MSGYSGKMCGFLEEWYALRRARCCEGWLYWLRLDLERWFEVPAL